MITTTTYVAAVIAIIVLATLGAMLRVLAIRRGSYKLSWFFLGMTESTLFLKLE